MDPWAILPMEKARHAEQFATVGPVNGMITGAQAKGFFMQSGLQPMALAQIWGLADMNGDGQMDLNEFSVACKLITCKLKGFETPAALPPSLLASLGTAATPAPAAVPAAVPAASMAAASMAPTSMMMAQPGNQFMAQPGMAHQMMPTSMAPGMVATSMAAPMGMQHPQMAAMGGMGQMTPGGIMTSSVMTAPQSAGLVRVPQMPMSTMAMTSQVPTSIMSTVPMMGMGMQHQQMGMGHMPMQQQHQMGMMQAAPQQQVMIQAPVIDWPIPDTTKVKYANLFAQIDKSRTGFVAGAQARGVLLQSGLPQQTLAQIWSLSDVDSNGKLSNEEFILSGHLCEIATKGEALPAQLPPHLVPPSFRAGQQPGVQPAMPGVPAVAPQVAGLPVGPAAAVSASASTVGTPGSVKADSVGSPSTFEDKRRENFNKGQAELERRRQSLIDQQKKEEEEKKKKEKEEAEAREKQRQELERQRVQEWEEKRKKELNDHRQREQEKLLALKARQTNFAGELEKLREKSKKLTDDIAASRTGVSEVKTFIDGMRASRDEKMQQMTALKLKLKEQNNRLLIVTQEKSALEKKAKANAAALEDGQDPELSEFELKKIEKEKKVVEKREELEKLKTVQEEKKSTFDEKKAELETHKESLNKIIEVCQQLYDSFDDKRREIRAEQSKRMRDLTDPDHAWGNEEEETPAPAGGDGAAVGEANMVQYRALYDFQPGNEDELAFAAGDIINVNLSLNPEAGWLGGELNGKSGWFPETYAEPYDPNAAPIPQPVAAATNGEPTRPTEPATAVFDWSDSAEAISFSRGDKLEVIDKSLETWWFGRVAGKDDWGFFPADLATQADDLPEAGEMPALPEPMPNERYVAVYDYTSDEAGDLHFSAGQVIRVVKKTSDWWTGQFGANIGVFPYNFVEPEGAATTNGATAAAVEETAPVAAEPAAAEPAAAPAAEAPLQKTKSLKKKDKSSKSAKKLELAKVVAPYEATSKEQLTLSRGQMLVIRKKTDSGWWQGEIQGGKDKKRQVGWFPASYVKLLESKGGAEKIPEEEPQAAPAAEPAAPASEEAAAAPATNGDIAVGSQLRALYDYAGTQDDELSFKVGEIIVLSGKDDEVWWKGTLDGREGVFPATYVEQA